MTNTNTTAASTLAAFIFRNGTTRIPQPGLSELTSDLIAETGRSYLTCLAAAHSILAIRSEH